MTSIDLHTTISTAARRIARETNRRPAELTVRFDSDGSVVEIIQSGMYYADPSQAPAAAVSLRGRSNAAEPMSQREAQDRLDATSYAATQTELRADHAAQLYLSEVRSAREYAASTR